MISKDIILIFKNFSKDEKPVVKNSALEIFGEFILLIDKKDKKTFNQLLNFYAETIQNIENHGNKKRR